MENIIKIKDIVKEIAANKEEAALQPLKDELKKIEMEMLTRTKKWSELYDEIYSHRPTSNNKIQLKKLDKAMQEATLRYEEFKGIVEMQEELFKREWTPEKLKALKEDLEKENKELAPRAEEWLEDEWWIAKNKGKIKVIEKNL